MYFKLNLKKGGLLMSNTFENQCFQELSDHEMSNIDGGVVGAFAKAVAAATLAVTAVTTAYRAGLAVGESIAHYVSNR